MGDVMFMSQLDSHSWRTDLSLYWSQDNGGEWSKIQFEQADDTEGHFEPNYKHMSTGYSALVTDQTELNSDEVKGLVQGGAKTVSKEEEDGHLSDDSALLHIVYEESDVIRTILVPDRIIYRQVEVDYVPVASESEQGSRGAAGREQPVSDPAFEG